MATSVLAPIPAPLPKKRRALIRVVSIAGKEIKVLVLGWNPRKRVVLRRDVLPKPIQQSLSVGTRFYAYVKMKSASPEELAESLSDIQPAGAVSQKTLAQKGFASLKV